MTKPHVDWEGCFPALVTPFFADGGIDEASFIENIRSYVLDDHVDGLVVCGHNGESWALSAEEKLRLVKLTRRTADQLAPGIPVITGVEEVGVKALVTEAAKARDAGADGLMITPPFFVAQTTHKEIFTRYDRVSSEVKLPIMIYNNPRRTTINLTPETIGKLADIEWVVAIKQAVRDFAQLSETIRIAGDRIRVFPGPASYIFGATLLGISGYVATGPDLLGREGAGFYRTIKSGDLDKARRIHHQLTRVYAMLNTIGTWPASFKVALELVGKKGGYTRDPVQVLDDAERRQVKDVLIDLGILR
jgi:4-hydroxy-tetrahydrodipicolinate synthase